MIKQRLNTLIFSYKQRLGPPVVSVAPVLHHDATQHRPRPDPVASPCVKVRLKVALP